MLLPRGEPLPALYSKASHSPRPLRGSTVPARRKAAFYVICKHTQQAEALSEKPALPRSPATQRSEELRDSCNYWNVTGDYHIMTHTGHRGQLHNQLQETPWESSPQ